MKLVFAIGCTSLLVLIGAPGASARPYSVSLCGTSNATGGFTPSTSSPSTLEATTECPSAVGQRVSGISLRPTPGAADTAPQRRADWTIAAAAGTTLTRLAVVRWFGTRSDSWAVEVLRAEDPNHPLEDCPVVGDARLCMRGGTSDTNAVSYRDL